MRRIISAMQISVDGFIEDPDGTQDWVDNWEDDYGVVDRVEVCVLGRGMYPGYEQYWTAVLEHPERVLPFSGKLATPKEVVYAKWAARTPHLVVSSRPLRVSWKNTRVISELTEIERLKTQAGKDIYIVGGAQLVSSLINRGLVDELRLKVHPLLLGGGKALFDGINKRHHLKLESLERRDSGHVYLVYGVRSSVRNVTAA